MEEIKTARAQAKFVRIAPRKVQIICDMIRGKDAAYAEALMANTPKAGCEHVIKVLKSAVANALDAYFCHREHHRAQNARVDFAGNESIKQAFFLTGQPTITYAALA